MTSVYSQTRPPTQHLPPRYYIKEEDVSTDVIVMYSVRPNVNRTPSFQAETTILLLCSRRARVCLPAQDRAPQIGHRPLLLDLLCWDQLGSAGYRGLHGHMCSPTLGLYRHW